MSVILQSRSRVRSRLRCKSPKTIRRSHRPKGESGTTPPGWPLEHPLVTPLGWLRATSRVMQMALVLSLAFQSVAVGSWRRNSIHSPERWPAPHYGGVHMHWTSHYTQSRRSAVLARTDPCTAPTYRWFACPTRHIHPFRCGSIHFGLETRCRLARWLVQQMA